MERSTNNSNTKDNIVCVTAAGTTNCTTRTTGNGFLVRRQSRRFQRHNRMI